eukprot:TRINITY_DN711_c0_g1_i3.p1 TRINITY_DN711_c0_g1~~TRINITY_DN711_c0_g1_i3.p1  ORF type:complete len:154 (+),score=27.63 TRINITY_DN711_c0_g1_i3:128-589(+)
MAMSMAASTSTSLMSGRGLGNGNARLLAPVISSTFTSLPRSEQQTLISYSVSAKLHSELRRSGKIVAMATGETSTDPIKPIADALKPVQEAWDKTDDKLAIGGLGFAALIILWASTGLIAAIDRLPILPSAFELIGILFSGKIFSSLLYIART